MAQGRIDAVGLAHYEPHLNPGARMGFAPETQENIRYMLRRILMEVAINRFEWEGFPDEINTRYLELSILEHALSVFFYDEEYGKHFALKGSGSGYLNMVGEYTKYMVYGNQFYTKELDEDECVPIWGNALRIPDLDIIDNYSARVADIDRSVAINAHNARRQKVARVSEKTKLSIDKAIEEIDKGSPVVKMVPEVMLNEVLDVVDFGIDPDTILNLDMLRDRQWQKAMNLLGINGANQDKKERLVAAEASANDEMVEIIRMNNLNARRLAAKRIKEQFGFDVEVDYSTAMENDANMDPAAVAASQGGRGPAQEGSA